MEWLAVAILLAVALYLFVAFLPWPHRRLEPEPEKRVVHHYSMKLPDKLDLKLRRK